MVNFVSPEREFTLMDSLSSIIEVFALKKWQWSVEVSQWSVEVSALDTTCILDSCVYLDEADCADIVLESARGKGLGLESLTSGLYELLEHIVYSNQSVLYSCSSSLRIKGDAILNLSNSASKNTDYTFYSMSDNAIASLPPEYCGGKSTGEFSSIDENLIRCYYTNNGWAAGASIQEATLHALNELIERDATSNILLSNIFDNVCVEFLIPNCELLKEIKQAIESATGNKVYIVSIPALSGSVVLSICYKTDREEIPTFGCGASQFLGYATYRSLLELWQELCADKDYSNPEERDRSKRLNHLVHSYPNIKKALFLEKIRQDSGKFSQKLVSYDIRDTLSIPNIEIQINNIVNDLHKYGIDIWKRDAFHYERKSMKCNPSVVQIVAPGLERFHVIRHGFPAELIGRLRKRKSIMSIRQHN